MLSTNHPLRGPLLMVLATGSYVINDSLMKLATEGLPPYQVLMMRGIAASLWGFPLLYILGHGSRLSQMFDARVLARNLTETAAILCFILALANMPIADATALGQITPMIVLLGSAILFKEKISRATSVLIACGFVGAILIARPTGAGLSIFAVLALANAVFSAVRDLLGQRVKAEVPGLIVAMSAVIVVLAGALLGHLIFEQTVTPSLRHIILLAGSGFFLIFGHLFLFLAYRAASASVVAPFYYCFTVWAVISGLVVFGQYPDLLTMIGILLVVSSGLLIVYLSARSRRLAPVS
jgi:drug/metabolite transporter (DMT)-like permease